jgi:integrase
MSNQVQGTETRQKIGAKPVERYSAELGTGGAALATAKRKAPGDAIAQVHVFFDNFAIPAATGRKRTASRLTDEAYRFRLTGLVKELRQLNMLVRNLDEITPKHVRRAFETYEKAGMSAGRMANVNTTLRRFGIWIGKPALCPGLPELVSEPGVAKRTYAAIEAKTWDSQDVDIEAELSKIGALNEVTELQLRLAMAFGVRVQEFLMFRPAKAQREEQLYVRDGTKGGRPRLVPIETEEQRLLLAKATEIASRHHDGLVVAKRGLTLRQARNHFYNTVRRAGINRKELGITTHGLRHGYACRSYRQLTGTDAPVLGGGRIDPALDRKARMDIAERLGHSRVDVTSAYLGSHRTFSRVLKENLDLLCRILEGDKEMASLAQGFAEITVLGPAAAGQPLSKTGALILGFQASIVNDETQDAADVRMNEQASQLAARAGALMGVLGTSIRLSWAPGDLATFALHGLTSRSYQLTLEV